VLLTACWRRSTALAGRKRYPDISLEAPNLSPFPIIPQEGSHSKVVTIGADGHSTVPICSESTNTQAMISFPDTARRQVETVLESH